MNCRKALRLASRAIDGAVSRTDAAALELHLASCVACEAAAARSARAWHALARVEAAPAPDDWVRIVAAAEARRGSWSALWSGWRLATLRPAAAWVVAGMVALGATGGVFLSRAAVGAPPARSLEAGAFAETLGDLPWGSPVADLAGPLLAALPQPERR